MNTLNAFLVALGGTVAIAAGILILLIATETVSSGLIPGDVFDSELAAITGETGAELRKYVWRLLALVESWKVRNSGIATPQAGLGQGTVRAHSQAMTVASPPFGSLALG
jgi:hypothetical protein